MMIQPDPAIASMSFSRRGQVALTGVPLVALFGERSSGGALRGGRTMLRVAPSVTSDESAMFGRPSMIVGTGVPVSQTPFSSWRHSVHAYEKMIFTFREPEVDMIPW